MLKKAVLFCVATVSVVIFFSYIASVYAVDKTTISISPLFYDLTGNPGDSLSNELLIRNSGADPIVISAEAQDFVASGEEGDIKLSEGNSTYSLASWIEIDSKKFTISPGQQKRIKFIIRIPLNAEPGGHYASVYANFSPTLENAESGAGVGQKISSLVLLKVPGITKEEARVKTFEATQEEYKGPVKFDIRIENTGSVHFKPKGLIAITDIWGRKTADVTVEQKMILPDSIRHMTANWENPPWFGKYTATLVTLYGNDNKQLTETTTFWIVPWKEFAIFGGLFIIIATMVWLGRKRIRKALKALAGK